MQQDCIFCKIAKKGLSEKNFFLENERAFAIFDIKPVTEGHLLIITKKHFNNYMDCNDEDLKHASLLAKKAAKKLLQKYPNIKGFNYVSNQNAAAKQVIFHLHIHVIPRY